MHTGVARHLTPFAEDVQRGLTSTNQKQLSPSFLYDDLGSALFEAITLLPEYGLTRADERLIQRLAPELVAHLPSLSLVAELGSGSGKKTRHILEALLERRGAIAYYPIDVSQGALDVCERELSPAADVRPVRASWLDGLEEVLQNRGADPLLLLFLGSTIGNLGRQEITVFLQGLRRLLRPGDLLLVGADLVKPLDLMLPAYDDPTGVTAAFNRNLIGRINRELGGTFDLAAFRHEARWDEVERRIEMHLVSTHRQSVHIGALHLQVQFEEGESIFTEASHKFTQSELSCYAREAAFGVVQTWTDTEWPFAETLWKV
jgi:dimethylhistidine N-methyltransferase